MERTTIIKHVEWIKVETYLPGNERTIQIWNDPPAGRSEPQGTCIGYRSAGKWWGSKMQGEIYELHHVTHWAELLGKPEDHG